ncbi:MAG: hypothetical protein IT328_23420 [Caldilineaceae bacterium]|nr:hypothetical protein [Caldilineaceae bacterium]
MRLRPSTRPYFSHLMFIVGLGTASGCRTLADAHGGTGDTHPPMAEYAPAQLAAWVVGAAAYIRGAKRHGASPDAWGRAPSFRPIYRSPKSGIAAMGGDLYIRFAASHLVESAG